MSPPNPFHPELRRLAAVVPFVPTGPIARAGLRFATRVLPGARRLGPVAIEWRSIPGFDKDPPVRVRVYRPDTLATPAPALLWIHGGGFLIGSPVQDDVLCAETARELGLVVVSVDYRLSPECPFPGPLHDCAAALRWMYDTADALGIDGTRLAIGGASAGGGLAAQLALHAHDQGPVRPVFQVLVYPMIDDRTVTRTDLDETRLRVWGTAANRTGWASYLGREPGGDDVPALAAPARRTELSGLPPAWIGVGTCDLFHDEDVAYAARLREAGVPCALEIVDGAVHGFDAALPRAGVSRRFTESWREALRSALDVRARTTP